ncbi:MAG: hypothetical protein EOO89_04030 [Pedobacter sp.]|nr:MAG: hypothetical protein EOO89_04030 [Pedobacter sp.]
MDTLIDSTLSTELQELYLENKEWLSDVLFLEDDMRFLQKRFADVLTGKVRREHLQQIEMISSMLTVILARRKQLKCVLQSRKHTIEQLLKGNLVTIGLAFIEEDAAIINEVKSLLIDEKLLKDKLFALVEQQNSSNTLKNRPLKPHRYPIF